VLPNRRTSIRKDRIQLSQESFMKTRWIVATLCVAALLTAKGFSAADTDAAKSDKKFEATCPVSGKPAAEDHVFERRNGSLTEKIYFCCDDCLKNYKEDRKKYATAVNRQLLETGQMVEVACPLTGKPLNKEAKAKTGATEVAFCCEKCLAKFNEASDEEKLKMAFGAKGMKAGFTKQTKCPVSGKDIDPEQTVEYKGEKVYFCCPNCPKAFEADPEKFISKVPQLNKKEKKEKKAA
jgi:YHS domain-containing protein